MVKEIRLIKGRELSSRAWSMGVRNPNWEPSWFAIDFPGSGPFGGKRQSIKRYITIKDGDVEGIPVFYRNANHNEKDIPETVKNNAGKPVPAEEILRSIMSEAGNVRSFGQDAKGYTKKNHFGMNRKWYVDYDSDLTGVLKEYGLEFETNQTLGEAAFDVVMGQLNAAGLNSSRKSPGQIALEEAKAQEQAKEIESLKEKLAEVEAQKVALEQKQEKQSKKKDKELAGV